MTKSTVFLSCPYSGNTEKNMEAFLKTAARITECGMVDIISPLFMHFVLPYAPKLDTDWEFWKGYSLKLLSMCDKVAVLKLDGWDKSTGVSQELLFAKEKGIPVTYIEADNESERDVMNNKLEWPGWKKCTDEDIIHPVSHTEVSSNKTKHRCNLCPNSGTQQLIVEINSQRVSHGWLCEKCFAGLKKKDDLVPLCKLCASLITNHHKHCPSLESGSTSSDKESDAGALLIAQALVGTLESTFDIYAWSNAIKATIDEYVSDMRDQEKLHGKKHPMDSWMKSFNEYSNATKKEKF